MVCTLLFFRVQTQLQAELSLKINHNSIFVNRSPRVIEIKTKINQGDLIKLKSFCTAKETINNTKRQPTDWERIFANDVSDQ